MLLKQCKIKIEGEIMLKKDIIVLKNYVNGQDDLELSETCMSVSLFLEKTTAFIKFVYEYCTEEQEEDFDVEWYELRDFIGEMFYSMCKKNAIITFPNPSYFQMLFIKKGNDKNIIKKLIKTMKKVNKANEKNAIKVGLEYNI